MKVSDIQKLHDGLDGLRNKKLPVKLSFVLLRNLKKIDDVVNDLEEKRTELIEKYGDHDEQGQLVINDEGNVKIENTKDFLSELMEIYDADVEMQFDTVSESDIEKCDQEGYDHLTVEEISALESMIK